MWCSAGGVMIRRQKSGKFICENATWYDKAASV